MKRKNIFYTIVRFSQRHSRIVIGLTILITIGFAFSAATIQLNADYSSLLPPDDESNLMYQELGDGEDVRDNLIITFQAEEIFTPEVLSALEQVVEKIEAFDNIGVGTHPFSLVTAVKKGTRLVIVPANPHTGDEPWSEEEASLFKARILADRVARNLVVSEDGQMILLYFPVTVDASTSADQFAAIEQIIEPLHVYGTAALNGTIAINDRVMFFLVRDLFTLLGISFLVIMIVYYLSFRAKRSVFLPLTVVVFGVIWCLGIISLLGYDLTIFNIITPPLVLTLGSSYSIHLLNEYYRSSKTIRRVNDKTWLAGAVSHINKTIILACLTSVAGFLSLLVTQIEQFREFGISTAIGISVCAVLTLFYLPAALHRLSNPKESQKKHVREGKLTEIVINIADVVVAHWYYILGLFGLLIIGFAFAYPLVEFETNYTKYFAEDDPLVVSSNRYTERIGGVDQIFVTLQAPEGESGYFLRPEILRAVDEFEMNTIELTDDITHDLSFASYVKFLDGVMDGKEDIPDSPGLIMLLSRYLGLISKMDTNNKELRMLINEDHTELTITFRYRDTANMATTGLENTQNVLAAIDHSSELLPSDVQMITWGNGERYLALSEMIQSDQRRSTTASVLVVFLITAVTFGSIGFGLFSIIPIAVGIMANYIFMVLFNIPFDMITMGFSSVTVGVGIDDAIHFILRYREIARESDQSLKETIHQTIVQTGRPIMLTSISIISGLMVLSFASFMPVRFFGILISIALFNTLLATLFILPALMYGGLKYTGLLKQRLHPDRIMNKRLP
ncbi:MAG: MMPL family transporter [Spirochaetia bacterium]|nr:MMPL family transporter [Spirochaetia bacterium]MCF7940917.1 MMPL family transporter [Spirochaetia bacterium]